MLNDVIAPHLSGYQRRDFEVVDYKMVELPGTGLQFRGPVPKSAGPQLNQDGTVRPVDPYFVCLGAAQTFGCFTDRPYPTLLSAQIGLPVLNLGYGGAGPEFFARQRQLLPFINSAQFVVLQVMSGRSQSNSLYECGGLEYVTRRSDGRQMGAQQAIAEALLPGPAHVGGVRIPSRLRRLVPHGAASSQQRIQPLIEEIRSKWIESYRDLLCEVNVPVVFFWFSKRSPDYHESYESVTNVFGQFPQLVTREMVDEVKQYCGKYVECESDRGSPQQLVSRFTGESVVIDPANDRRDLGYGTWSENRYYPSPEMHEDASRVLSDAVRSYVDEGPG